MRKKGHLPNDTTKSALFGVARPLGNRQRGLLRNRCLPLGKSLGY